MADSTALSELTRNFLIIFNQWEKGTQATRGYNVLVLLLRELDSEIARSHPALESINLPAMPTKSKRSFSKSAQKPLQSKAASLYRRQRHPRPVLFPSKFSVGSELAKLCNWHKRLPNSRLATAPTRTPMNEEHLEQFQDPIWRISNLYSVA